MAVSNAHLHPIFMSKLTGPAQRTTEQLVELTSARWEGDHVDITSVFNWISHRNIFVPSQPKLRSVSSGLTASDDAKINCVIVEEI